MSFIQHFYVNGQEVTLDYARIGGSDWNAWCFFVDDQHQLEKDRPNWERKAEVAAYNERYRELVPLLVACGSDTVTSAKILRIYIAQQDLIEAVDSGEDVLDFDEIDDVLSAAARAYRKSLEV